MKKKTNKNIASRDLTKEQPTEKRLRPFSFVGYGIIKAENYQAAKKIFTEKTGKGAAPKIINKTN